MLARRFQHDLVPLTFGARVPIVLVLAPGVEAKSVAELIALSKKAPGKLADASSGYGGGTHLAGELFDLQAGTRLLHVPYKGSAPAMADVKARRHDAGAEPAPTSAEAFGQFIAAELTKWNRVAKAGNITAV